MPGLVAFGRRWSVGSDDLFLPSVCLCFIHSVWLVVAIVALVVNFETLTKGTFPVAECSSYVSELLIGITLLLSACFLLEMGLTVVSLRGSILHDTPRKPAQYLIYILLIVLASKLVWSGFAAVWIHNHYFDCNLTLVKQIILGLVICTWFILFGVIVTAWCTYDVAGRSWVKMKRYQANLKEMELKHPTYRRSGSRHRNWRQRKVIRAYQNSWNHRCRLLFCCMHRTERNRDSFADLARLLSEFFRDLDVVPSDVVVGLLLLRRLQRLEQCSIVKQKRNNTYEFLSGIAITPKTKFVAMNDPNDLEIFRNVVHFMHYASAAYGWPWYLIPNGFKGLWNLSSNIRCCCCGRTYQDDVSDVVVEDNCCYCNYAVIPTMFTDPDTFDVIHATFHVDVGETPFFVVCDYEKETIVISIRGTLSLKDVITDLNAESEPLPLKEPKEDWQGHKGMVQAAVYMKAQLEKGKILEKAFNRSKERGTETYRLVIVGHSLGAGTAAILAVLLKDDYPNLQCYAYSPPGGLLSMPVVEYTKSFVTSVIVGKDVVPRIGLSQMEALRADLLNAMKKSHKPKWHTLVSGMACCCCVKPEFALPQRLSSAPSIQSEEFMRSRRSLRDLREVTINPNESAISLTVHQPLFPPGRIMHIVRKKSKKDERLLKKGEPVFQALWTENTDYGQVLISPGMIQDHMPDTVLSALSKVVNNHGPAKPQRTGLAASTSPLMLSRDSLLIDSATIRSSSHHKLYMEGENGRKHSSSTPSCTLMNPSPLIIDADAEVEAGCGGDPPNLGLNDLLAHLNLSWDYVTNLQDRYLEKEEDALAQQQRQQQQLEDRLLNPQNKRDREEDELEKDPNLLLLEGNSSVNALITGGRHQRTASLGNNSTSSGCESELGSTFKEIFGPIKYEEWMAPLASPETLSEISSLSSRASFFMPRDQSPLMRMKGGRNGTSSSLHRYKNGKANGHGLMMMGGGLSTTNNNHNNNNNNCHHARSFSCTYPTVTLDVSILSSGLQEPTSKPTTFYTNGHGHQTTNGNDYGGLKPETNGHQPYFLPRGDHNSPYSSFHPFGHDEDVHIMQSQTYPEPQHKIMHHVEGNIKLGGENNRAGCNNNNGTEILDPQSSMRSNSPGHKDDDEELEQGEEEAEEEGEECRKSWGETKRVSFNLKSKYASKDSGCSVSDTSLPLNTPRYEPTYPIFSHQEEYGVPSLNSPHYNYCGYSPEEDEGESTTSRFPFPSSSQPPLTTSAPTSAVNTGSETLTSDGQHVERPSHTQSYHDSEL